MHSAIQHASDTLQTIQSPEISEQSFQKALFSLWMGLENSLTTVTKTSPSEIPLSIEDKLDKIIDAQDQVADAACQSRAKTFEDLLYKLAIWRADTPDFETLPAYGDRKDRIIYSVFRDLVTITGIEHVKTEVDKSTNFLGLGTS